MSSVNTFSHAVPVGRTNYQLLGRLVAYALLSLGVLRLVPTISFTDFHNDFSHYYLGGSMFASGLNAYTEPLEVHCQRMDFVFDPTIPYAAHPPLILAFFSLFSSLSPPVAYGVWLAIQIACFGGCVDIARRILGYRWSSAPWLLMVALFTNAICVQTLFYYSQVQLLVGLLMYAAILAHLRGKPATACGIITLAAAFKLYPAVLLPWFFFKGIGQPGQTVRRAASIGVVGIVCLLTPGIQTWIDFLTLGIPALSENAAKWCNYSAQNLVFLLYKTPPGIALASSLPASPKFFAVLASLAVLVAAYSSLAFFRPEKRVALAVLLAAAMVGGLVTWSHYLSVLFLPVALLWKSASRVDDRRWQVAAYAAGVLLMMPKLDCLYIDQYFSVPRVLLHFYPLFAAGLVTGLLLLVSQTRPRPAPLQIESGSG